MKAQFNASCDVATVDALREKAKACGAPIGDLLSMMIRFSLARIPDDRLIAWAESHRAKARAGELRRNERAMLTAFEVLASRGDATRFSARSLADAAGVHWAEGYLALQSLATRGLVTGFDLEECDRWGRPVRSWWTLKGGDDGV